MRAEAIRRRLDSVLEDSEGSEADEAEGDLAGGEGEAEAVYTVPSTGAQVTASSAKSLLFHYCSKLPSDK